MSSIARNLEKKKERNEDKKAEKNMAKKISMFDRIPEECLTCKAPFDKKSKIHAQTWIVSVFTEQKKVVIICPECYNKKVAERSNND